MKLELKHLAPYLPYGLKLYDGLLEEQNTLLRLSISTMPVDKPILRPLSDLTQEIFEDNNLLIGNEQLNSLKKYPQLAPYYQAQKLFEWHFDIFGLIKAGLAIDINTIK